MQDVQEVRHSDWLCYLGRNHAAIRRFFEAHPVSLNAECDHGHTPLGYAVQEGDLEAVTLLLELGATLSPEAAVMLGMETTVAAFIAQEPDLVYSRRIHARTYPLLWFAARDGHFSIADLLIRNGADVNITHSKGDTPLHGTAATGNVPMLQWLMERGANVNAVNRWGVTPLFPAVQRGHLEAAQLLVARGADPTVVTMDGDTLLGIARLRGHGALATWLEQQGAR